MNTKNITVRRALLSVSDKTGIVPFARFLTEKNIEILSTGGTAAKLQEENIPVTDVSEVTGYPEIMDGRVKTTHPLITGGILGLRDAHQKTAEDHKNSVDRPGRLQSVSVRGDNPIRGCVTG